MKKTTETDLIAENQTLKIRISELENIISGFSNQNLLESEELYFTVFEKNQAIKLLIDPETGAIIDANSAASNYYGYSLKELKRKKITDINVLSPEKIFKELNNASSEKTRHFLFKHKLASGEIRDVEIYTGPVTIQGKRLLFSIVNDISERIKADEKIIASKKELEQQKLILDEILSVTTDHFIMYDKMGRHIYVNKAGLEAQGLKLEDVKNKTWRDLGFPREAGEHFENLLAKVFSDGQKISFEAKFPSIKGLKDWEAIFSPLHDATGNVVSMVASYRDITEQKKYEEKIQDSLQEKEILLKEIHHRVKNNLQVISSLLYLQSNFINDPAALEMLKESQNRVRAISIVHEKLYQAKNFSKIDFRSYVDDLINNILQTYGSFSDGISLNLEIENIFIGVDMTILCGLILNELISNILKHAFLLKDKQLNKLINIKLKEDGQNNLILIVSDNGKGFPTDKDFENTESLGLQLVNMLVHQLEGTIKLTNKNGTEFIITFLKYPP